MPLSQQIIFEDNHLIVINKRSGQLVQGDKTGDICLIDDVKHYLKTQYNKTGNVFLGSIHRLDRPCSGVVIFAKTSKALERMNEIFKERKTNKSYLAVTEHAMTEQSGLLQHYLIKKEQLNKSFVTTEATSGAKLSQLKYKLLASSDKYSCYEIELLTGRHHQIRVQLSASGCPIKGDLKYGAKRSNKDASIHLHALSLSFEHPVQKKFLRFLAYPPDEPLWNYFSEKLLLNNSDNCTLQNTAGCVFNV